MNQQFSYPKEKIKILLLEGVDQVAVQRFEAAGYRPEYLTKALTETELLEAIKPIHILGIRSATNVTPQILNQAKNLIAVGCFCIGTNQVALKEAMQGGTAVFNAPYSNTRSVAELVIAEIIMLARQTCQRNIELHQGIWNKSAAGCFEVRQKKLGIVGYGHIGGQVSILAEALGMEVYYYDIINKLQLGNARQVSSLKQLLEISDFVTLHVPETPETKNLIGEAELGYMKPGGYLLNLSRGTVVVIPALIEALKNKKLAGAALDVYPQEPKGKGTGFSSELCGLENVILTPHVGGSTQEAQHNIGIEVSAALIKYLETGSSTGSVNFPQVELPTLHNAHRVLNIHRNVPGVLSEINSIISAIGANISAQFLNTREDIGYLIMDVDRGLSHDIKDKIEQLPSNIRTRILF